MALGERARPRMPAKLVRERTAALRFGSQGNLHAAHLSLEEGRFVYHMVYEVGFDIGLGDLRWAGDTLVLVGDSLRTDAAVRDPSFYQPLFAHARPSPYRIDTVRYVQRGDTLFRSDVP